MRLGSLLVCLFFLSMPESVLLSKFQRSLDRNLVGTWLHIEKLDASWKFCLVKRELIVLCRQGPMERFLNRDVTMHLVQIVSRDTTSRVRVNSDSVPDLGGDTHRGFAILLTVSREQNRHSVVSASVLCLSSICIILGLQRAVLSTPSLFLNFSNILCINTLFDLLCLQ